MAESATEPTPASEARTAPAPEVTGNPTIDRVAALRATAEADPVQAQVETWAWIEELGEKRDADGLEALFAQGLAPRGLNGPTEGILVCTLTNPLVDVPVRMLTSVFMPWMGKSFDSAQAEGVNRMTSSSKLPAKLLWPRYGMRETEDGNAAFDFQTRVEAGAIEPSVDVLVIDYADVSDNPALIIRQIRDELVQLVPDTYLGRILFRLPGDRLSNIGYFALRQPAGTS
jgi:hypothetical protein